MKTQSPFANIILIVMVTSLALAGEVEKGVPADPQNTKAVGGSYYCGDGKGYNVTLKLEESGSYSAEWRGCLGKYGEASGIWKLSGKQIVLTSKKETEMMQGHLKTLDILKYKDDWIFVRSDGRDFYDKYGVSRYSCFQKVETKTPQKRQPRGR